MNASLGDLDNNGFPDVYVSNVHARLQAEGSLLWMNDGEFESKGHGAFEDQAGSLGALNEHRFGWGRVWAISTGTAAWISCRPTDILTILTIKNSRTARTTGTGNDKIGLTSPDIHGYADSWAEPGRVLYLPL